LNSDIAIVGAGIIGLSVAFHLAERGVGTIVVYEREGIGAGA
jgi:sarcosine oxidase, subunit beta